MPTLRRRLRAVVVRLGAINPRGALAIAGITCIAIFAASVWPPLAWLVVGVFLFTAAGAPTRPGP
jgi:hypothetical protein